ncbi:MAG: tetratricopeptide repeat protein, partial [bacterium]|nr:tetratricopeptide repeat protein [bacterium]
MKKKFFVLLTLVLFCLTPLFTLYAAEEAAPDFSKGMLLFSDSNYKEALKSFEQSYKIDSKSDDTLYMLALTQMKLENYSKASEHFKTLIDKNPGYTKAYQDYGISLYIQGKYQEAIPIFEKSLELEPKNPQPLFYQGLAYYFNGDKDQSLNLLNRVAKSAGDTGLGQNAQSWIEKIETGDVPLLTAEKKSKWSLVGAASFFYDSNVSLDPDAEDVADLQTNQEEIMGSGALDVRYRLLEKGPSKLYLGVNAYQTAYADKVLADVDMNRFNYGRYIGGADWHYLISEKVQFRLPIFYYYSILGASRYVQSGV